MRRNNLSKNLSRIAQDKDNKAVLRFKWDSVRAEMEQRARQAEINGERQREMLEAAQRDRDTAIQAAKDNTLWQKFLNLFRGE